MLFDMADDPQLGEVFSAVVRAVTDRTPDDQATQVLYVLALQLQGLGWEGLEGAGKRFEARPEVVLALRMAGEGQALDSADGTFSWLRFDRERLVWVLNMPGCEPLEREGDRDGWNYLLATWARARDLAADYETYAKLMIA